MTERVREASGVSTPAAPTPGKWGVAFRTGENLAITLCLGAMVLIPLAEMALRSTTIVLPGSGAVQSHLTLFLCMLGGMIAAREGRLLALSTVTAFLRDRAKAAAALFSGSFAAAITGVLFLAAYRFMMQTRDAGDILAYGVPRWLAQAILPLGFGLIAFRLILHAAKGWKGRVAALVMACVILALVVWLPVDAEQLVFPSLVLLLVATILGAPIFVTLGGAALILLWGEAFPIEIMPIRHYEQVTNPSLPAIPMFTLAGYLLAEGGAPKRLVRVFQALTGHLRGGPAIVTVLVCAFFTSFTGASGVTILALGGLLMPVLAAARYSEKNALGLLTGSGSIGLLFPPCLPLILYAIIAEIDIGRMFLAGIIPGILMVLAAGTWGVLRSPKSGVRKQPFRWAEAGNAVRDAKWELLLPVVALTALFSGFATAVEASAITALYAFVVEALVYRDLSVRRDLPKVMAECGLLVGAILLILGVALGFTGYLIMAQVPDLLITWVTDTIESPLLFLLALNAFLLLAGCIMDIFSAIIVIVPLMVPIGLAFGIDPVHLGIIFLANLELGYLTPPVGMNLFLSSYRFNKPMPFLWRSIIPILLVLLAGVLLITYVPFMSTFLPGLFQ